MSGNRSIASAKNRRAMPERTNEPSSRNEVPSRNEVSFKNEVAEPRVHKKDVKPKKLTKEERDLIIAQFQLGPVTLFTIARNQEMRIQNIEEQIELYNKAVFQDLNDRIEEIKMGIQQNFINKEVSEDSS